MEIFGNATFDIYLPIVHSVCCITVCRDCGSSILSCVSGNKQTKNIVVIIFYRFIGAFDGLHLDFNWLGTFFL